MRRHLMEVVNEPAARAALLGRLVAPWRRRRFHSFGANSLVHRPIGIYAPWQMALGDDVVILHGAWLSVDRQAWESPQPVLRVGNRVSLRPFCTLGAAESLTIEDNVVLSAFCTVLDCDHTQAPGVDNVLQAPLRSAPTRVGAGTWVGERTSILRGADVGRHCIIGANSIVRGRIPDYSVAVGAPARVVRTLEGFGDD